jgi:stage III sporulation protein SpoIIIAA
LDLLFEIILDLGRLPEARFSDKIEILSNEPVSREDLRHLVNQVGQFTEDNRAGIERTLHRISAIRNRKGEVVGITCRIGRAIYGTVDILRDVIESSRSILLLGRPGVGKTTLLRESARVLADDLAKRVIIVDTSNEIGGDGDIAHAGVGRARRMQVPAGKQQHAVMIEAVENHMPEVIVIDEIGTEAEAQAARTIAERGVQLIATAHGNYLDNLLQNPTLSDLIGGIQVVTLSDEEARRRGTRKTILERKTRPTFQVLVEIQEKDRLAIHHDVAAVVDGFLRGAPLKPEIRIRALDGQVEILREPEPAECEIAVSLPNKPDFAARPKKKRKRVGIYTYGVSRKRLEQAIEKFRVPACVVSELNEADLILTLKAQAKRQPHRVRDLRAKGMRLCTIRSNTLTQMENFLRSIFDVQDQLDGEDAALQEAESAVSKVFEISGPVELSPRNAHLRFLQHQVAGHYGVTSESKGREPFRRVVIYPSF